MNKLNATDFHMWSQQPRFGMKITEQKNTNIRMTNKYIIRI